MNSLKIKSYLKVSIFCLAACGAFAVVAAARSDSSARQDRMAAVRGTLATYNRPPRLPNGRVNIQLLIEQLLDIHANTYSFAIHNNSNDWTDLQLFLPVAQSHGIRVWGSVVPPTESLHGKFAEPFRLDYDRWAVEFARLSLRETNLVAWSIDDFTYNTKTTFTPEHLRRMLDDSRAINPRLAFIPCCYFKPTTANFIAHYEPLIDGILFPYRHESGGANLKESDLVESEVHKLKKMTGPDFPIIIDVYATAHSRLGKSTPEYVRQVMTYGKESADGVMVYCHQDPKLYPEKYAIVKGLFTKWSAK